MMKTIVEIDRKPVEELLAFEISAGIVNKEKLIERLSASMEFVNREIKAFDIKSDQAKTLVYNDALLFRIQLDGKTKPLILISPRLRQGKFYALRYMIGEYKEGIPYFKCQTN